MPLSLNPGKALILRYSLLISHWYSKGYARFVNSWKTRDDKAMHYVAIMMTLLKTKL